jgi:two-component system, cell cycle sensor histidine kinase and response regulator CckA
MQSNEKCWQDLQIFSLAIETSSDAIIIGDLSGKIKYVNAAAMKMYETAQKSDILGRYVPEFIAERDRERATQSSIMAIKTGIGFAGEFGALKKTGAEFPVEVTIAILKDETGKEIGFIDIVRDISKRKKAEEALKQREERYHQLFSNLIDGFAYCQIILDKKGKPTDFVYLEVNDAFERLTGLRRAEVIGKKASKAIPGIKESHPELFESYGKWAST